jgi:hypothetical protein
MSMSSSVHMRDVVAASPDPWETADLDALIGIFDECFPGHPHVRAELRANAEQPSMRGDRTVHQILATVDGHPAGFVVVHANLRRGVGLIHFLGVREPFRGARGSDRSLASHLVERAVAVAFADGVHANRPLIYGVVAESEDDWLPTWRHWGFTPIDIAYVEPFHGMHWATHGEATFFEMTLVRYPNPLAEDDPSAGQVAAVSAFSLDHYLLPADHPRIAPLLGSRSTDMSLPPLSP